MTTSVVEVRTWQKQKNLPCHCSLWRASLHKLSMVVVTISATPFHRGSTKATILQHCWHMLFTNSVKLFNLSVGSKLNPYFVISFAQILSHFMILYKFYSFYFILFTFFMCDVIYSWRRLDTLLLTIIFSLSWTYSSVLSHVSFKCCFHSKLHFKNLTKVIMLQIAIGILGAFFCIYVRSFVLKFLPYK